MMDIRNHLSMIGKTIDIVRSGMENGMSLEEMKNEHVLREWESWGRGPFNCDAWIEMIHDYLMHSHGGSR